MCVLGHVHTNSIHYGYLLLLTLVVRQYSYLQLATGDVYEAEVHVFIYGHTWF
jgi:hypothetical protein